MGRGFLTARWQHLAMLSWRAEPALLRPFLPAGTELDLFDGEPLLSVVGFRFLDTRLLGVPVPFHRDFDEVNLRFYVRREAPDGPRRGVVFVRELVPRAAITCVARWLFHESYRTVPMRHSIAPSGEASRAELCVSYSWTLGREQAIAVVVAGNDEPVAPGTLEEFVTERHWGYTRRRDGRTSEYQVEHPRWTIRRASDARLDCDVRETYGAGFEHYLVGPPLSALLADGSAVSVSTWRTIGR